MPGPTTKLGPLARTDLCAGVKGLLDRLMTHFGLGSSGEDPRGSLLGGRSGVAIPGTSTVCLGGSAVPLGSVGGPMPGWLPMPAWPACLTWGEVVACLGKGFPSRGYVVTLLPAWEEVLTLGRGESAWLTACLPAWVAWETAMLLPSPKGRWAPA